MMQVQELLTDYPEMIEMLNAQFRKQSCNTGKLREALYRQVNLLGYGQLCIIFAPLSQPSPKSLPLYTLCGRLSEIMPVTSRE